jgi:hypothetical protein
MSITYQETETVATRAWTEGRMVFVGLADHRGVTDQPPPAVERFSPENSGQRLEAG